MQNNYQVFHRRQDIGKRISLLHREEPLSIGLLSPMGISGLSDAIEYYVVATSLPLYVLLHEDIHTVAELRAQFPDVTFILFAQATEEGTQINVLANECYTTYVLVARSDIRITQFDQQYILSLMHKGTHPVVVTPRITNSLGESLPVIQVPMIKKDRIDPLPFTPLGSPTPTLYPYFGMGLYERALFQRLRGFDDQLTSDYWQFLDFGIRCWLYGYTIMQYDQLSYQFPYRQTVVEDRSECEGYCRCNTKALCVRQIRGKNYVKKWGRATDTKLMRTELTRRLALYKTDFFQLMEQWKAPEV